MRYLCLEWDWRKRKDEGVDERNWHYLGSIIKKVSSDL